MNAELVPFTFDGHEVQWSIEFNGTPTPILIARKLKIYRPLVYGDQRFEISSVGTGIVTRGDTARRTNVRFHVRAAN